MKNSVSVTFYAPYEDVEFNGLRKALSFAIESGREADVLYNGELVWQSYDGSQDVEVAMKNALVILRDSAHYVHNDVVQFHNSNIVKINGIYAKKIGEALYDTFDEMLDVCSVYEDIHGNKFGYDPHLDLVVDIADVHIKTLHNNKNRKLGRRANSHNKWHIKNKKLHENFAQIEEDELPF